MLDYKKAIPEALLSSITGFFVGFGICGCAKVPLDKALKCGYVTGFFSMAGLPLYESYISAEDNGIDHNNPLARAITNDTIPVE